MSIKFNSLLFEYKIELFATATAQAKVLAVVFLVGALHFIDTIQTSNNILLVSIQSRFTVVLVKVLIHSLRKLFQILPSFWTLS